MGDEEVLSSNAVVDGGEAAMEVMGVCVCVDYYLCQSESKVSQNSF